MARKIAVEIIGDASSLERAFRKSATDAEKFNRGITTHATKSSKVFGGLKSAVGGVVGVLGVGGLAGAVKASFDEMTNSQKVAAQTRAAIESTGGAANVTAGHVDHLATRLMNLSGQDDETVKSAENMLLTFRNVRNEAGKSNDIFDQATHTIFDMSQAMGEDSRTAALQLGKALNDPVHGMTALQRVGVQFTDGQKKAITAMVDSGNTMGAQKVILHELNKEFGGSAKAAGKTLSGQLGVLKNNLLNLGGSIMRTLLPSIKHVVTSMVDWLKKSQNQKKIMDIVHGVVSALKTAVGFLSGAFRFLSRMVGGNTNAIKLLVAAYATWKTAKLISNIGNVIGSIGSMTKALTGAGGLAGAAEETGASFAGGAGGALGLAAGAAAGAFAVSELIRQIPGWDAAMKSFGGTVYDTFSDLGLVNDPMKQYAGATSASALHKITPAVIAKAKAFEAGGLSQAATATRLTSIYGLAPSDAQSYARIAARGGGTTINVDHLHVHGDMSPHQIAEAIQKHYRRQPHTRR